MGKTELIIWIDDRIGRLILLLRRIVSIVLLLVSRIELITWIGSVVGRSVIRLKRTICDLLLIID